MKLLSVLILLLSSLLQVHQSNSQLCNNRVTSNQFLASPSTFGGVITLTPSRCTPNTQSVGFNCLYSVILGDNEPVPLQPNLDNSGGGNNDIGKFLVWPSSTERPYMSFGFGGRRSVTAINIEFLNYPAQGFSLPNLELYTTSSFLVTDPTHSSAQRIEFELRNNDILSRGDYRVTSVSLNFSRTSSTFFLLHWDYTGVYNLNYFMVSEVDFCNDNQPLGETQITFQDPQSNNSVIIPTVQQLKGTKNTTINCIVSSSGLFEWQWRQNGSVISNNGRFIIFTADGTRTSILQLTGLNVSDAAEYTCVVRRRHGGDNITKTQTLNLTVAMDLPGQMTGYLGEKQVVLICEVYGFLMSTNPPTWRGRDGNPIDSNTPKYTIDISNLSQAALLLSNGSSVLGWRSTLTINRLGMADEGNYTCMVDGNSATVQLTVVAGSAPTTIPITTTTTTTTTSTTDGATLSNDTIPSVSGATKITVAIVVVLVLVSIIVVVVIALLVIVRLKTHKQRDDSSKVHQLQNVNVVLDPETREDEEEKESIMMLYAVPDKKKKVSNQAHGVPEKSSELVEYLDFKEEGDVGMLYAIPDKKKKASNKALGVPERSTKLIEHLDYEEVGIVTSGMGLSESSQTDSDAQRSSPSPAQQEPIDVAMLYAIPDKKKKVSK